MAKFYMEDETVASTDEILDKHHVSVSTSLSDIIPKTTEIDDETYTMLINHLNKITEIPNQTFRIPHGNKNYVRLGNTNLGDLLHHIQKGLNTKNLCCLQLITGELHGCLYFDPDDKYYECAENRNCDECISRWMNSDKW